MFKNLEKKYEIKIITNKKPDKMSWDGINFDLIDDKDLDSLNEFYKIFQKEFCKYAPELVKKSGVKRIYLVKNMTWNNNPLPGFPDGDMNNITYDIKLGMSNLIYKKHIIHHEFYHIIENNIFGTAFYKDPKWIEIGNKFNYGDGGIDAYGKNTDVYSLNHPYPGMINLYSTYAVEEDKAEIFSILFMPEELEITSKWCKDDNILNNKIKYMKKFIKQLNFKK